MFHSCSAGPELIIALCCVCLCVRVCFQEILSRDVLTSLSDADKALVWESRYLLTHYPSALAKLLHSVKWNVRESVYEVYHLLHMWKAPSPVEALQLLDFHFPDPKVRAFAVSCLEHWDDNSLQLYMLQLTQVRTLWLWRGKAEITLVPSFTLLLPLCILSQSSLLCGSRPVSPDAVVGFVSGVAVWCVFAWQVLKYELYHDSALSRFLLRRCLLNTRVLGHIMFWLLKSEMHNVDAAMRCVRVLFLQRVSMQMPPACWHAVMRIVGSADSA